MQIRRTAIIVLIIILGLGLAFYPHVSSWYSNMKYAGINKNYDEAVAQASVDAIQAQWDKAYAYNNRLTGAIAGDPFAQSGDDSLSEEYIRVLNVNGSDIMAHLSIPIIGVNLPIYHGTSAKVLQEGLGHLEGTSVPIGGENTHSVITGHTGLSSAKLFTDLTQLKEGDTFYITVLDKKLAYQVYDIQVVEPTEIEPLMRQEGRDLCTLITCTPYGLNTHRLFVHGERIDYNPGDEAAIAPSKALTREQLILLMIVIAAVLLLLLSYMVYRTFEHLRKREHAKRLVRMNYQLNLCDPARQPGASIQTTHRLNIPDIDHDNKGRRL